MKRKPYTTFILAAAAAAALTPYPASAGSNYARAMELSTSQTAPVNTGTPVTPVTANTHSYKGVVTDLYIPESASESLQFTLIQPKGMNLGANKLTFKSNVNTKYNFNKEDLKEGAYFEVYYNPGKTGVLQTETAIEIHKTANASSAVFNGKVISVTPDPEKKNSGDILLNDYATGQEFIFHYGDSTKFNVNMSDIKPGVSLNIHYPGILTRSIPAQGSATEISRYVSTSTYRGTLTDIQTQKGITTLTLQRPDGSGNLYSKNKLKIKLNQNSKLSVPVSELKKGSFIEVFYNSSRTIPTASSLFAFNEGIAPNFNGIITNITPESEKGNAGSITVTDLNGTNETIFHYSDAAMFKTNISQLKAGDSIHIFHKGIMTLSLPAQGNALEIASYRK